MAKLSNIDYFGKTKIAEVVDKNTHFSYNGCNADRQHAIFYQPLYNLKGSKYV